jgi:O-antigen/teichoic acid export membrane protein
MANMINLWTGPLILLLSAVGRPGIQTRYAFLSVVINVGLTIPLVLAFGMLGTVVATAVGMAVASLYVLRLSRRHYNADLRHFLKDVPSWQPFVTVAVVVALELIARPAVPRGAVGLLTCGVVAAPGLAVFALTVLGPRRAIGLALRWVRLARAV